MNPSVHPTPSSCNPQSTDATRQPVDVVSAYFDERERWEDAAATRLTPAQRAVSWDDCWIGLSSDDQFVFGRVATVDECAARERTCGASAEEIEDSTQALHEAYARGYRLGAVFSAEHPEGNFESIHLSNVLHRITSAQLDLARMFNFDADAMRRAGALHRHPDGTSLVLGNSRTAVETILPG